MPTIKVYAPNQLPDRGVSETQFNIWIEELEIYLSQEADFRLFLPGEAYAESSLMKTTLIDSLLLKERMKYLQEEQLLSTGLS